MARRRGTRTWEGGPRARRPGARPWQQSPGGLGWEEVISATCAQGVVHMEKENLSALTMCQDKSESL